MRRRSIVATAVAVATLGVGAGATVASGTGNGERVLSGVLRGANEIGPDGRRGAGDRDGYGGATGVLDGHQLCFGLTAANIDAPVAAHIHRGRRHENGPIVIPLTQPQTGDPGASSGCVQVQPDLARELLRRPRDFYWNVHTREFPGGAIRGQVRTLGR